MNKSALLIVSIILVSLYGNGQCLEFENGPYIGLGTAPCNEQSFELQDFEVYASEAYTLQGVVAGAEYNFGICNGPGAGSWTPDFTIVSPMGTVDAFGADGTCSISWIASESGNYTIIINEDGSCGIANQIDNGYPMLTTISGGEECPEEPVLIEGAESFEGGDIPECWTTIDQDDDGFNWYLFESQELSFDGSFCMRSESYENGTPSALTPDNYLITPQLDLGAEEDSLYYVVAAIDPDYPAEYYSVLVSTSGTDIADFTDEIFSEELSSANFTGISIDMTAYANQSIHIAFRHHDVTDQFAFTIDAVKLPGVVNCNPAAVSETGALAGVEVFPNPSTGIFNVVNNGSDDTYQIRVFDLSGKQVASEQVVLATGAQHVINLNDVATGVYTVQLVSSTESGAIRVVKK